MLRSLAVVLLCLGVSGTAFGGASLVLNEVRTDQPGADNDEYFEIFGAPGTSLDGITFLVIGDGTGASGVIESVVDLTGSVIPPSGFFVAAESTFTLGVADLVTTINFENSDNLTFLLVEGFTGADGDDLDTDDDCVLDVTPWTGIIDAVAAIEEDNPPAGTECHYGLLGAVVGPDAGFAPGHFQRCPDGDIWVVADFDPLVGTDTPGASNFCGVPPALGDSCSDPLIASDGANPIDTTGATDDGPSPCGLLGSDIWLSYVASCTGDLTLSTCDNADFDTVIAVYDAAVACPPLSGDELACNDDSVPCTGNTSQLTIPVVQGQALLIQLGGFNGAQGTGTLTISCDGAVSIPDVLINEVRTDQPSSDIDEYIELIGDPGTVLDGLTYIVIGDGTGGSGVIESVTDITGTIGASGFFLITLSSFSLPGTPDLVTTFQFENSDNVTHLLVGGFTGAAGDDLDLDDDGTLDVTPWAGVADLIALVEEANPPAGTEFHYGPSSGTCVAGVNCNELGPDSAGFVPGHAKRCPDGGAWAIGAFDPAIGDDTPGAANDCSPLNDDCSNPATLNDGDTAYSNAFAASDGPSPCGSLGSDVWFFYTASCNGEVTISTCSQADYDTVIAVYPGAVACPPVSGDAIVCNDDAPGCTGNTSEVTFTAVAGETFLVQVGGFLGAQGSGTLTVSCMELCLPITDLVCNADCATGVVSASWTNGETYAALTADLFDASSTLVETQSLAGDATSVSFAAVPNGAYSVVVTGECVSGMTEVTCDVAVAVLTDETNVVVGLEFDGGDVDSVAALTAALDASSKSYVQLDSLDYDCFDQLGAGDVVWVQVGTFPNNYALTPDDGQALVDLVSAGVSIYLEGGDIWGFDAATAFIDYDGVDGTTVDGSSIDDGDDSFLGMVGSAHENVDVTGLGAAYTQDRGTGNDFTDRLVPTGTAFPADIPGTNAGVIWSDDGTGGSVDAYATGLYYKTDEPYGDVLAQSWEFGGYGGDQVALAQIYSDALKRPSIVLPQFNRGDTNADGLFNIADMINLLGVLFPSGSPVSFPCDDAGDTNDDGLLNIADAINGLGVLFPSGSPALIPAPFGTCGEDPTSDALDCAAFPACP